ncbi:MAG: carboxypeptidase-like regulatory domain-containing protein [Pyrinomonadaceae bacterium]
MAFRERTVNGFVVDADGGPVQNGTVSFQLDKPLGYTATHVVINRVFTAVTDSLGSFSVTLWCDEDSFLALNYTVTFPIADGGQPQTSHTVSISLAYEDGSAKDLGTLIAESQPPPSIVSEATWASLIDARIALAQLQDLGDVVIDLGTLADGDAVVWDAASSKWVNSPVSGGGGGGMAIGGSITSATAGSILFAGVSGVLAQNNTDLKWDDTSSYLQVSALKTTATNGTIPIYWNFTDVNNNDRLRFVGASGRCDLRAEHWASGSLAWYNDLFLFGASIGLSAGGFTVNVSSGGTFLVNDGGSMATTFGVLGASAAKPVAILKLAASQAANSFEIQNNSGTLLTGFDKAGAWMPTSMADSAAPNNSVYYSTTASKFVYKDSSGTVNALY